MLQTECLHTLPPPPKPPSEPPPEPLGDPEREPIGDPIPEPEETPEPDRTPDPDKEVLGVSRDPATRGASAVPSGHFSSPPTGRSDQGAPPF